YGMSCAEAPPSLGDGGGGEADMTPAYNYSTDALWLELTNVVTTNLSSPALSFFVVHTPDPTGVYDLFMTTNLSPDVLGLNLTNWTWVLCSAPGQTNLVATSNPWPEAYFRLGLTNDSDADDLTDAFYMLVCQSS